MDKTSQGDRMKKYEAATDTTLMPRLPIVIRLDGKAFSTFTKGMKRPFDDEFRKAMVNTAKFLVHKTNAKIAYTQSDEISLILYTDNVVNGSVLFDTRVQKICSVFASWASVYFMIEMTKRFPEKVNDFINEIMNDWDGMKDAGNPPVFDCRIFAVPNKMEAYNAVLWRVNDAVKNSIAMVAQANFEHEDLLGLNCDQMQYKLITEKGINWNDFDSGKKQGVFVRKEKVQMPIPRDALRKMPQDRIPANGMMLRNRMVEMDMPNFRKVTNALEVIFNGEKPTTELINAKVEDCSTAFL
jgi:tRNA(His) 5'-end guanylyltransferase